MSALESVRSGSTVQPESVRSGRTRIEEEPRPAFKFARKPWEVATDNRLTSDQKCIYDILAGHWRPKTARVYIGTRRIADLCNVHTGTVTAGLRQLAELKHIEIEKAKPGRRSMYKLTHPMFSESEKESPNVRRFTKPKYAGSREVNKARLSACAPDRDELARILAS